MPNKSNNLDKAKEALRTAAEQYVKAITSFPSLTSQTGELLEEAAVLFTEERRKILDNFSRV